MTTTATSFYVTGGTVQYDAPCYVERQADWELLLVQPGREQCSC